MRSARPYIAGGIILWAVALQAHVWSLTTSEKRQLVGDSQVSFTLGHSSKSSGPPVDARGADREDRGG
jgi:hypothetical protein